VAKTTHKGPFAPEERDKFIGLIRQGYGIHGALADLKTSHRRYLLTCERVKGFRQAIQHAIVYRLEFLVSLRYAEALGGDSRAQEFLINRHDRRHEFLARLKIDAAAAGTPSWMLGGLVATCFRMFTHGTPGLPRSAAARELNSGAVQKNPAVAIAVTAATRLVVRDMVPPFLW